MITLFYVTLRSLSPSDHYEACFIPIIWNGPILQLAVQCLTRAFCSWPSCWGSVDWLVIRGVLLGRWRHLLLFTWCLHSGSLLWWFFFFLWISCWCSLQNSTSLLFLQDSRLAISGCVPAASISSHGDLQWLCSSDLIQFIVGYFIWPLDPNHLSQLSLVKTLVFSGHPLTHPRFRSFITVHF